jgi:hypothetical protein
MMKGLPAFLISLIVAILSDAIPSTNMDRSKPSTDIPVLSAPVKGVWRVVNSPGHASFAYDLAAINPVTKSTLSRSRLVHIFGETSVMDYYSWGEQVRSPVSGTVISASDNIPDRESLSLVRDLVNMLTSRPALTSNDIRPFAGNYVVIDAEGFCVFVAHLRSESIRVQVGDRVMMGQVLGEVGNSGFTLEPHLHIQLADQVDNLFTATALPFVIDSFEIMTNGGWDTSSMKSLPKGKILRFELKDDPATRAP